MERLNPHTLWALYSTLDICSAISGSYSALDCCSGYWQILHPRFEVGILAAGTWFKTESGFWQIAITRQDLKMYPFILDLNEHSIGV